FDGGILVQPQNRIAGLRRASRVPGSARRGDRRQGASRKRSATAEAICEIGCALSARHALRVERFVTDSATGVGGGVCNNIARQWKPKADFRSPKLPRK